MGSLGEEDRRHRLCQVEVGDHDQALEERQALPSEAVEAVWSPVEAGFFSGHLEKVAHWSLP